MKRLVIGILAHVDSGKTTLSEALLYRAGAIRAPGRVDHGDTVLDADAIERERGITIFSKMAEFSHGETAFTLLDTPGHVDFSAEMERTLSALDYAVLVVSGTDGVQSHTETLWALLRSFSIPTFVFVNKMDLDGADIGCVMGSLRARFGDACVDFTAPRDDAFYEQLALCGEELMEQVLESGRAEDAAVRRAIAARQLVPCFSGSALRVSGVDELLGALDTLTDEPERKRGFAARVFKIADDGGTRLTYLKLTGGTLPVRGAVSGTDERGQAWTEKVNALRVYSGEKFRTIERAEPGMVVACTGLTRTYAGEGLGEEPDAERPQLQPVLTYDVLLPDGTDDHTALGFFRRLEQEDPQLRVQYDARARVIRVSLMGEVQLEVLRRVMKDRFDLPVEFAEGSIVYRETIAEPVEGIGHYEPLRHYAEVHLLLEPGARGSGLVFAADCSEDDLARNWQRLILTHLAEKTHVGVLTGSPITDMKITLVAGRAHEKHTEGGDFRQATYRAVRQGLRMAKSVLLEPWYAYRLELPAENVGRAMTDLQRMGGRCDAPETAGETAVLTGAAPVRALRGYAADVAAYTRGRGRLGLRVQGYEPCADPEAVIAEIGYDCDADVDNTADSVFCSHGAGTIVRYDEVPSRAQVDSGLRLDRPEDEEAAAPRRAADYVKLLATDEELLKIFERTYGPVKSRLRAMEPAKKRDPDKKKPYRAAPLPEGPEYLLVDGYNIIFAWDDLARLARSDLHAARQQLMDILCNYQGYRQCELILVFDAYKVKGNPGSVEPYHNITVVYTKEAETADSYIERVTHELRGRRRVRVATSDGLEQVIILGHGALRVSARAFGAEVEQVQREIGKLLGN